MEVLTYMLAAHLASHLREVWLRDTRPHLEQVPERAAIHVLHRDRDESVLTAAQARVKSSPHVVGRVASFMSAKRSVDSRAREQRSPF